MTLPRGTARDIATPEALPHNARNRNKSRIVLIGAAVFLLAAALVATGHLLYLGHVFDSKTQKIEVAFPQESTRPEAAEPAGGTDADADADAATVTATKSKTFLLMGSDIRGAINGDSLGGAATNQRSDTLMLLHIPADRSSIYTMSIMRDLWVDIPRHGPAKINAALAYGGVPLVVETVESLLHQRIDHVAIVDFEGFKGLTDALGTVEVQSTVAFTSSGNIDYSYVAGPNLLDGDKALAFVRERNAFMDGDYQRVRNQQAFLKALFGKTTSAKTLSNPVTITNMVQSIAPFISVDKTLDARTLAGLAIELRNVRNRDFYMFTLPTNGTGTSSDGQSIVLPNPEAMSKISDALINDTLGQYIQANNFDRGN